MDTNTRILIVGAGAFGTSTAYHLSLRGYKSIRVVDRYPVPSVDAAATDISKIIRSDYNEPLYAALGLEAIDAWKSSKLFEGLYHVPGWVLSAYNLSVPFVEGSIATSKRLGVQGVECMTAEQVRKRFPVVTGDLEGWNINVWNPTAGWAPSGEALRRMALAAQANGVEYISGNRGYTKELIFSDSGRCTGVRSHDDTVHMADIVVLAAGAWTPSLIDLGEQMISKGHCVAHLQLSPAECQHYKAMPILDNLELGYFLPPTEGVLKMAHSQYIINTLTNHITGITTSVPHTFTQHPADDFPTEIEAQMRSNLARVFPELTYRPFCYTRICWDADTVDRHFLISPHPDHSNLFLATGGSSHGFKFMPILGKYIADMLEEKLDVKIAHAWRWRAGQKVNTENLAHLDPEMELRDLTGWQGKRRKVDGQSRTKL
jgi:sarcosine oxidase/L-pipecolate oxidase